MMLHNITHGMVYTDQLKSDNTWARKDVPHHFDALLDYRPECSLSYARVMQRVREMSS
jgi:hypothetical protein